MKHLFYLFTIISILNGCAVNKDVLRTKDAKGLILIKEDSVNLERAFYIVEPIQLLKAHKPASLTYLGSVEKYHLMRVWNKKYVIDGEINYFAIEKDKCVVENERSIPEERSAHPMFRHVEIENGKCIVRER